jgi:hypothetical protein
MRGRSLLLALALAGALLVPVTGGCSRTPEKTPVLADPSQAKDMPPRVTFSKPGDSSSPGKRGVATPP